MMNSNYLSSYQKFITPIYTHELMLQLLCLYILTTIYPTLYGAVGINHPRVITIDSWDRYQSQENGGFMIVIPTLPWRGISIFCEETEQTQTIYVRSFAMETGGWPRVTLALNSIDTMQGSKIPF